MNKATHKGHCQCCGRLQMLPGGLLSKHGYTVDFGYFNGVCRGERELPFEQSKDLIESFITGAEKFAAEQEALAIAERANTSLIGVHLRIYVKSTSRYIKSGYQWQKHNIVRVEHKFDDGRSYGVYYIEGLPQVRNNEISKPTSAYSAKDADEEKRIVARDAREKYAAHHDKLAADARQYAKWQKERIKDWKPALLIAIA